MSKISKLIKVIGFIVIAVCILYYIQKVVSPKFDASQGTRTGYEKEEKNTVDVLLLGSSNMFHTINPLFLYENTGITSFDFGSSSQSLNMSYMYLQEALKTQMPELVCLEVLTSSKDYNHNLYEPGMRWGFTYFPDSLKKYQSIYTQLGKIDADFMSYVFPILRYKDRWKELTQNDFEDVYSTVWKGCTVSYATTEVNYGESYWKTTDWELPESNVQFLDAIKDLCDEKGIELVLFKSPTPTLWKDEYSQGIAEYATANQLPFIDYNAKLEELNIDVKNDFMDAGHVNINGSRKITEDFGEYLSSHYDLKDHRGDENNSWDKALAEQQRRDQNSAIRNASDIYSLFNGIVDDNYTVMYSVCGEIGQDQVNVLKDYFRFEEENLPGGCVRMSGENIVLFPQNAEYSWHDTLNGRDYASDCSLEENEAGETSYLPAIYFEGKQYSLISHGIQVLVYDNQLNELVCCVGFDADNGYSVVK